MEGHLLTSRVWGGQYRRGRQRRGRTDRLAFEAGRSDALIRLPAHAPVADIGYKGDKLG
jgi:hypothetical protein